MKKTIVIVCMQKSGSTYLYHKLKRYTGFGFNNLRVHHEIQEFAEGLNARTGRSSIAQIHAQGSKYAADQLNSINADVIILTRNLYDIVISMRDFIFSPECSNEIRDKGILRGTDGVIDKRFCSMKKTEQYDYIIDLIIPNLIHFYVSWKHYQAMLDKKPLWMTYEKFFSAKAWMFKQILAHCGIKDNGKIKETIYTPEAWTRFNKGITRVEGEGELNAFQVGRIKELVRYFPEYSKELLNS